jgi:hypothetical protein
MNIRTAQPFLDSRLLERVLAGYRARRLVVPEVLHRVVQRCGLAVAASSSLATRSNWRASWSTCGERILARQAVRRRSIRRVDQTLVESSRRRCRHRGAHGRRSGDGRACRARLDPAAISPSPARRLSCEVGGYRSCDAHHLGSSRRILDTVIRLRAASRGAGRLPVTAANRRAEPAIPGKGLEGATRNPPRAARIRDARAGTRVSPDVARAAPPGGHAAVRQPRRPRVFPGHRADGRGGDEWRIRACGRGCGRGPRCPAGGRRPAAAATRVARGISRGGAAERPDRAAYAVSARGRSPRLFDRTQELAYLANAIVAGCSLQAGPFTAQEASDAAVAILQPGPRELAAPLAPPCTPRGPTTSSSGTTRRRLPVGWTVLHEQVCMYAWPNSSSDPRRASGATTARSRPGWTRFERRWRRSAGRRRGARDALDVLTALDMPAMGRAARA